MLVHLPKKELPNRFRDGLRALAAGRTAVQIWDARLRSAGGAG